MSIGYEELGSLGPKKPGPEETEWIHGLMRGMRNVTLLTEGPNDAGKIKAHGTVIYSAFTELLTGRLQAVWRSRENRKHSEYIERDCRAAAALGERAVADVGFLLYDSSSRNTALEVRGWARKIYNPMEAFAALAIINGKRERRGMEPEPPLSLQPDNQYAASYAMYVADVYEATIPAELQLTLSDGRAFAVDDGHATLDLNLFRNFELDFSVPRPWYS